MKIKAFTLAEVLITLTILGVVAAITIPSITNNYKERITVAKVKKMYSVLDTAYSNALAEKTIDENQVFGYSEQGAKDIAEILKLYFSISKDCGTTTQGKAACGIDNTIKRIDGSDWTNYGSSNRYYGLKLKDGSVIWFRTYTDSSIALWFDVNGSKGPNTFGKDVFHFAKTNTVNYIRPVGDTENAFNTRCKTGDGMGCTAWVVYKGNMDYLKCRNDLTWSMNKCP